MFFGHIQLVRKWIKYFCSYFQVLCLKYYQPFFISYVFLLFILHDNPIHYSILILYFISISLFCLSYQTNGPVICSFLFYTIHNLFDACYLMKISFISFYYFYFFIYSSLVFYLFNFNRRTLFQLIINFIFLILIPQKSINLSTIILIVNKLSFYKDIQVVVQGTMPQFKTVMLTGGLGFIGSHTLVQILENTQLKCVVIDDLSNCFPDVLPRVQQIVAEKVPTDEFQRRVEFHQQNVLDLQGLDKLFASYKQKGQPIQAIIHFAGLKAVHQSMEKPILYFQTNVVGSMNMFKMMEKYDCKNFIFSSTSTVYGDKDDCRQTDLKTPMTPYGESKTSVEMLMGSLAKLHKDWRMISLRYFNPCGAHKSGLIGDEPYIYPNNLFPYIQEVLCGKREKLSVFGNDYPTPDGTCVRDYIHITDLANGHLVALQKLSQLKTNYDIFNLGTGKGLSVYEVVKGYEQALGKPINWVDAPRRPGDFPKLVSNPSKVYQQWGWKTKYTIKEMCEDSVNFVNKRLLKRQ